jgi:hypothetical protein
MAAASSLGPESCEQLGRVDGHRAVEVNRNAGNFAGGLQPGNQQQQQLSPSNRKCRNDDHPATPASAANDIAQLRLRLPRRMGAVAVSRLHDQIVRSDGRDGRAHQRVVRPADIPGKQDGPAAVLDADAGSAEQMPRTGE